MKQQSLSLLFFFTLFSSGQLESKFFRNLNFIIFTLFLGSPDCRELVKKEKWSEALETCPQALKALSSSEENNSERYHLLVAHAKALLNAPSGLTAALTLALEQLEAAIKLKPALTGPYLTRAECFLKLGRFEDCRKDLERFDESARLNELLRQVDRSEGELKLARDALKQKNWRSVGERASAVLKNYSPACVEAQTLLQEALLKMEDRVRAKKLLVPEAMDACFLAKFYFSSGDLSEAQEEAKKCTEPSKALEGIKEISQIFKEAESMLLRPSIAALEALQKKLKALEIPAPGPLQRVKGLLCLKYAKVKNSEAAIKSCQECLKVAGMDDVVDYTLALSEAFQHQERFDDALKALEDCSKKHKDSRLQEAIKACQKAKHDAANPDYYKLLGLERDASEKQIKLAYRKLAQKYHPDKMKNATPEERRRAELKMGLINRANDVLSDKEKRSQYDRGIDPENPQGGPFGHGGPGARQQPGGGFHFGGGGGGGVPFEFIFEALRQQQQGGQGRGGHFHHQQHQQRKQQQQHHQQFHFDFHDEL